MTKRAAPRWIERKRLPSTGVRLRRSKLFGAALVGLAAGCGQAPATDEPRKHLAAAPLAQQELAVSGIVTGNPPRYDIVRFRANGTLLGRLAVRIRPVPWGGLSWSPDGKRIAFTGAVGKEERSGRQPTDIYVADADGLNARRLTRTARAARPVSSPDGKDDRLRRALGRVVGALLTPRVIAYRGRGLPPPAPGARAGKLRCR